MVTIEETLKNMTLGDILPVLSLNCKRVLVEDLERVLQGMGTLKNHHPLAEVYRVIKLDVERETKRLEKLDSELLIDTRT
ncbi:MAG: hypothetical protein ABSG57_08120 [Candidatus Bathyarchaeia archaeon]